ncbi:LacI family transcriptional regulator [Serinibacter arcticus]|uniref:LacI family transcriptional regulator n=1 Tax=Serinibacter arcticus TaxID=1655435 RepID=A0A2U1ZXK4_9MICO|nr:LacI family DNA-binding transcriptional regulator [Serinibacter arcticus]PWD51652.1 LacI family transcriptional regulator [Serinibacter arcticus]
MAHHAPTLDEVAREAGVSRSTASRAINGGNRVSPAAQAAVDAAIAHLGFVPNRAARALATSQTGSIALVIPEPDDKFLSDPFLLGVLRGVSGALSGTETQLVLLINHANQPEGQMSRYLRAGHVDGAIITSPHAGDHLEDDLRGMRNVVFIGRPFRSEGIAYVDVDNVEGGRLATRTLLDAGRTRIGTISGPTDMTAGLDRLQGFTDALGAVDLPTDAVESGDFTAAGAEAATHRLLDRRPDLDALFVASDSMAVGVRIALADRGLRVPEDVALVGFDNLGAATAMTPRLTTVDNPLVEMVDAATRRLLARLGSGEDVGENLVLPPTLVPGSSDR